MAMSADEVRPMSYAETLSRLRDLLAMWGRIPPEQCLQHTLHSMKVTLLAFWRRADFSLESRHLQGHHVFAPSSTWYGRDDIAPILTTQFAYVDRVHSGSRPRTPILRGVSYAASEPQLDLHSDDLSWAASISELPFFDVAPSPAETDSITSAAGRAVVSIQKELEPDMSGSAQLEEETSESEGSVHSSLRPADEVAFLCAETSHTLHASIQGRPTCNSRGVFRMITHPSDKSRLCRARARAALFAALD